MFGLGWVEIAIVLGLGYFAFRHVIARRFPNAQRALGFAIYAALAAMLAFGILARLH